MRIEAAKAITPPSLLGIDRRIAYANKKYHSGCMWTGVTKEFAGVKFSGSVKAFGDVRAKNSIIVIRTINPTKSLVE